MNSTIGEELHEITDQVQDYRDKNKNCKYCRNSREVFINFPILYRCAAKKCFIFSAKSKASKCSLYHSTRDLS